MRTFAFIILLLTSFARAEDWTTTDGVTFHHVKVISHDTVYVTITHAEGGTKLLLSHLSPELQLRFGYNKKDAEAALEARKEDERERQSRAREQQKQQEDEANLGLLQEKGSHLSLRVFQVLPNGLLCRVKARISIHADEDEPQQAIPIGAVIFLNTDTSSYVDEEELEIFAYPDGRYQYKSGGLLKTVKQWTPIPAPAPIPVDTSPQQPAFDQTKGSINDIVVGGQ